VRAGWALLAIAAVAAPAQRPTAPARDALRSLVSEADTVPAEFAADILIRVAQAAAAVDRAWARDLLDEAFRRAGSAQQAHRASSVPLPAATRQYAEALAADTPLDAVSLQLRVVQLMRTLDPAHARELFEWIALAPEPSGCETTLVPATDAYYLALAAIARDTFPRTPSAARMRCISSSSSRGGRGSRARCRPSRARSPGSERLARKRPTSRACCVSSSRRPRRVPAASQPPAAKRSCAWPSSKWPIARSASTWRR
jgi:hypothetical protein